MVARAGRYWLRAPARGRLATVSLTSGGRAAFVGCRRMSAYTPDVPALPAAPAIRRRRRASVVVSLLAALCLPQAPLSASASHAVPPAEDDVVIAVKVDPTATPAERRTLDDAVADVIEHDGGQTRVDGDQSPILSLELPADHARSVARDLAASPAAVDVSLPARFELMRIPRDPQYRRQARYLAEVGLQRAWNRTRGSKKITIAVVDSGVDVGHVDLKHKVVGRHNAVYGGRDITDRAGHGTAVASVAAAVTDNRRGIAGVGWRTSIMGVKVSDRRGQIWGDALAHGIRWATKRGADVINLSLGSEDDDSFVRDAIEYAVARDVVVVAAVSNEGLDRAIYPAAYPGVLSVGATDRGSLADFSDRGPAVDVAAPGVRIRAAVPGGYARVDGTSFAAAVVSGQVALIRATRPGMKADKVTRMVTRTTRPVGKGETAASRVHVFDSVRLTEGTPGPPRQLGVSPRRHGFVLRWQAPALDGRATVQGYRVEVRRPGGRWQAAARGVLCCGPLLVGGLAGGRVFDTRVRGVNRFGLGLPSTPARFRTGR